MKRLALLTIFIFFAAGFLFAQTYDRNLPDLTAKLSCPSSAMAGEKLKNKISVKIMNIGKGVAKDFSVDLVISSDTSIPVKFATYTPNFAEDALLLGGREHVSELKGNSSMGLRLNGANKIPEDIPSGYYYIATVVDPGNIVQETNEGNNVALCKIYVKGKSENPENLPDLVALKAWIKPSTPIAGQKVYLGCDFKNGGTELKGNWELSYVVNGKKVYFQKFGNIPAGATRNPAGWFIPEKPGGYAYTCILDSGAQIVESNESNNMATTKFEVETPSVKPVKPNPIIPKLIVRRCLDSITVKVSADKISLENEYGTGNAMPANYNNVTLKIFYSYIRKNEVFCQYKSKNGDIPNVVYKFKCKNAFKLKSKIHTYSCSK